MTDLAEIKDTFALFDDWEDRYRYLIDLGKELPALPVQDRTEDNLVRGCQSQVWLAWDFDTANNQVNLQIDSDAHIVRGLAALVLAATQKLSPAQLLQQDITGLFNELKLLQHLSPTRGNGLRAMLAKIQSIAQSLVEQPSSD